MRPGESFEGPDCDEFDHELAALLAPYSVQDKIEFVVKRA